MENGGKIEDEGHEGHGGDRKDTKEIGRTRRTRSRRRRGRTWRMVGVGTHFFDFFFNKFFSLVRIHVVNIAGEQASTFIGGKMG